MTVDITNVADTFGNELKHCLHSFNPEVMLYVLVPGALHVVFLP